MGRLRRLPGALRADLWATAADPLPRMARPRWLSRLPHVLVILYALVMGMFPSTYQIDPTVPLLAMAQAAILILAMSFPLPAWWASIAVTVIGARTGMSYLPPTLTFPWMIDPSMPGGPVLQRYNEADAVAFPWTGSGIALQAGVLLLLALRVRPRVAAEALAITTLVALGCVVFIQEGNWSGYVVLAVPVNVIAVVLGAGVRMLRTTRTRLEVQEELTAEERARRTLLEERGRIARELHDVVAHHMSVISIQAQVAPHLVENPPDELKENLAGIRQNAVEALTELRRILGVLRAQDTPGDTPQPTLDRLDELLANVRGAGVELTAETTGEPRPLSPGVELSAFRIVQEALSNAMRHAPGAPVTVQLHHDPDTLTIRIANAAPVAPVRRSPGAGHGLLGMRERAAMLGGDLVAGPTPEGGYEVRVVLPVDSQKGIKAIP